jgi:prepilin-type processing-associated H-X9-DG protein
VGAALVVLVLYPVFQPRPSAKEASCRSNLKQLGTAVLMYVQDYDNRFPPASFVAGIQSYTVPYLLYPYVKNGEIWACRETHRERDSPAAYDRTEADVQVDYGYNAAALNRHGRGVTVGQVKKPADTVLFAESSSYRTAPVPLIPALGGTPPVYPHQGQATVAFVDGHVGMMPRETLEASADTESGQRLGSGIDRFLYWNLR